MGKPPTVYDVAERAGVSIATVSFVFRKPDRVRDSTRQLVTAAARELGYVPSASARSLAAGRTGVLGIYSFNMFSDRSRADPSSEHPIGTASGRRFPLYVDEVQWGFELECRARGFATMLGALGEDRSRAMTDIAGRVDGVAVLTEFADEEELARLAQRMPVVLISQPAHEGIDRVISNNRAGVRMIVDHLVEDHRLTDLAFVGDPQMSEFAVRFGEFNARLSHFGVHDRRPAITVPAMPLDPVDHAIQVAAASGGVPAGYVCASDQIALSVLESLARMGRSVPGDAVVTGFDGIIAGHLSTPQLTSVEQPMADLGRLAARSLIRRLEDPSLPRSESELDVRLVLRESCGC